MTHSPPPLAVVPSHLPMICRRVPTTDARTTSPGSEATQMPHVNIKLVEGVFAEARKHALAAAATDVRVNFEGTEGFREVAWVSLEELHPDGWHIGGRP